MFFAAGKQRAGGKKQCVLPDLFVIFDGEVVRLRPSGQAQQKTARPTGWLWAYVRVVESTSVRARNKFENVAPTQRILHLCTGDGSACSSFPCMGHFRVAAWAPQEAEVDLEYEKRRSWPG